LPRRVVEPLHFTAQLIELDEALTPSADAIAPPLVARTSRSPLVMFAYISGKSAAKLRGKS
jgi:hypothetical protein